MRAKLFGLTAVLMAGISTAAFAEVQNSYQSDLATTTVTTVTVNTPLTINTTAVGNIITSAVPGTYTSNDNQATDNHTTTSITGLTTLNGVTSTGGATVATEALGNVEQINTGNTNFLANGGQGVDLQATGGQPIVATTSLGDTAHNSFAGLDVTSSAVGNNISATSTSGFVGVGDSTLAYYGLGSQVNGSTEAAILNIHDTDSTGALTGTAQAIGNAVSAGVDGAGVVSPNLHVTQANSASQTATANLTHANLDTTGNSLGSNAIGNVANFGVATTGIVTQSNTVLQTATTNVNDATVNGAFSAQAVGDALSFNGDTGGLLINQNSSGPGQTATLTASGPLILNAATGFSTLAVGNDFTGTLVPGQAPGTFWQQQDLGAGPVALTNVSGVGSAIGLTTVSASAVGNLASLSAPGAFMQSATAPVMGTANISGSSFGGGLSVNTAAIGNSISVK